MIRIERVPLPDGLRALAHRDPDGGLLIYVSSTLDAPVQRTAVMAAVRASRRSGGPTAAPLGLALLVGLRLGLGSWRGARPALRRSVALARHIRPVGWAAGSAVAAGAVMAGLILSTPARPHPATAPPAGGGTGQSSARPAHAPGQARRAAGGAGTPKPAAGTLAGQPQAAQHSLADRSPSPPSSASASAPAKPAPTSAPSPSPSPTPTAATTTGPPGTCVIVLGIPVCVPVSASVSASVGG